MLREPHLITDAELYQLHQDEEISELLDFYEVGLEDTYNSFGLMSYSDGFFRLDIRKGNGESVFIPLSAIDNSDGLAKKIFEISEADDITKISTCVDVEGDEVNFLLYDLPWDIRKKFEEDKTFKKVVPDKGGNIYEFAVKKWFDNRYVDYYPGKKPEIDPAVLLEAIEKGYGVGLKIGYSLDLNHNEYIDFMLTLIHSKTHYETVVIEEGPDFYKLVGMDGIFTHANDGSTYLMETSNGVILINGLKLSVADSKPIIEDFSFKGLFNPLKFYSSDPDGDGLKNIEEFELGTDPDNPDTPNAAPTDRPTQQEI
jgi:hypothetical protein